MIWFNEQRKNIMEKYETNFIETSKKGGELWGSMTGDEKQVYVKKYEALKVIYQEEMKEYKAKGGGADSVTSPKQSISKSGSSVTSKSSRKRHSPQKGTPNKKFKSKEFIDTEDESSSAEDQRKKKQGPKQTKLFQKVKKENPRKESSGEEMDTGEPKSKPFPKPTSSRGRSTRSRATEEELQALPSGSDYEESIASLDSEDKSSNSDSSDTDGKSD
ncbi:hypothetical protein LOD99_8340 [Oopsacas minuta]|uniref:HMG box domain-containing protein n=1 Tax=Oopsacas minuta TaxID=111878 RepID=A0AAV7JGL5_9METZ|nr:hypothetical protein LOD99_8340 [Oopsacas minuta]